MGWVTLHKNVLDIMYSEPSVTVMVVKGMLKLETSTAFQLALIYNIHVSNNLWKTHEHDLDRTRVILQPLARYHSYYMPVVLQVGTKGKWVKWEYQLSKVCRTVLPSCLPFSGQMLRLGITHYCFISMLAVSVILTGLTTSGFQPNVCCRISHW